MRLLPTGRVAAAAPRGDGDQTCRADSHSRHCRACPLRPRSALGPTWGIVCCGPRPHGRAAPPGPCRSPFSSGACVVHAAGRLPVPLVLPTSICACSLMSQQTARCSTELPSAWPTRTCRSKSSQLCGWGAWWRCVSPIAASGHWLWVTFSGAWSPARWRNTLLPLSRKLASRTSLASKCPDAETQALFQAER